MHMDAIALPTVSQREKAIPKVFVKLFMWITRQKPGEYVIVVIKREKDIVFRYADLTPSD